MRLGARAVRTAARANQTQNDENKADTTSSGAGMACGDWEVGWPVEEPSQARSHCQERQEGRLAEGPAT